MGKGVTHIGDSAFANCNRLREFEIPGGVRTIADSAFFGNGALSENIKQRIRQINPNIKY